MTPLVRTVAFIMMLIKNLIQSCGLLSPLFVTMGEIDIIVAHSEPRLITVTGHNNLSAEKLKLFALLRRMKVRRERERERV